jgi:hypothetical protein
MKKNQSLNDLRDNQIKKIVMYARKILDLEIAIVDPNELDNDDGRYYPPEGDDKGCIYVADGYRKLEIIFVMLHEIGHHIDFLKRGTVEAEEKAYSKYPTQYSESPCPDKEAELIRYTEEQAMKYARELSIYLDLRLPEFSFLADEINTRLALDKVLKKGFTTDRERRRMRKLAREEARRIINGKRERS